MANTNFRTSADLVNEALANLGVLASGQATDPEDFNYVNEKLEAIFRMLGQLEICYIPDLNNIPGAWFSDLADIVAGECAEKFGTNNDFHMRLLAKGLGGPPSPVPIGAGKAALSLKQQLRGRPTYEPARALYF